MQPAWQRTRDDRYRENGKLARWEMRAPRLKQIALVEPELIPVPDWALRKAIKGLTSDRNKVWLGRIAANLLARLDREVGGNPKLTVTSYRACRLCGRVLLGAEAEARFEQDRKFEGHRAPCGPDCVETERALKEGSNARDHR